MAQPEQRLRGRARSSSSCLYWIITWPVAAAGTFDPLSPTYVLPPGVTWLRGQRELGAGGLDHWQFVCSFSTNQRLGGVTAVFPGSHAEPTRSTAAESYVWKDDTAVPDTRFNLGAKSVRRNSAVDWERVWDSAKSGDLASIPANVLVPHYRTIRAIRSDYQRPSPVERTVHVFWGRTGTGKSRRAWDEAGLDAYTKVKKTPLPWNRTCLSQTPDSHPNPHTNHLTSTLT